MSRYYTGALYKISTIDGIIAFIISTSLGASVAEGVLIAAVSMLLVATLIPVLRYRADKALIKLRRTIKEKILLDETASIVVGDIFQRCFVITTESSMFIISQSHGKATRVEIKKSSVRKISFSDDCLLRIFLDYDKCIKLFSPNIERLGERLAEQGFGK